MKNFILASFFLTSFSVFATDTKEYLKTGPTEAKVVITTTENQAAVYIDTEEFSKFLGEIMEDKNSELFKIKNEIEKKYCDEVIYDEGQHVDGCGIVLLTDSVLTSFSKGGWSGATGTFTLFVGFRMDGTGHNFESEYMIQVSQVVEAEGYPSENEPTKFVKTLKLEPIKKL